MAGRNGRSTIQSVIDIAQGQYGVVLSSQIRSAGVTRAVLSSLRSKGLVVEIRPGAYCVGAASASAWQRVVAVGLLGGAGSALSHYTAARLHRIPGLARSETIHVTVELPRHPRMAGVMIHRVPYLCPLDCQESRGLTVTNPARTLIDLASDLSIAQLSHCLDEGLIAGIWDLPSVEAAADRAANRAGVASLRKVLAQRVCPEGESALETRVIRALQCFGPFEVQHQVAVGGRVFILDIAWPGPKVAVESDGWSVRRKSRSKFDHDRRRGNVLIAHGWTVVHLTSAMTDDEMRAAVFQVLFRAARGT